MKRFKGEFVCHDVADCRLIMFVVVVLDRNLEPVGDRLDQFMVEILGPVVREGDGRSLGLSCTMKKFSTDKGPYIGL